MNTESKGFPVEIAVLPAINQMVWEMEEAITNLCGTKAVVVIKFPRKEEISLLTIQQQVCEAFGVSWSQIESRSRKGMIPKARFAYCWLCREYLKMSLQSIGDTIGGRDHTTIMYAVDAVKDYLDTKDDIIAPMLRIIESTLTYVEPKTA